MSGEKTEQPTPKKLRDARNKGQVAQSKDVSSTAMLIILFAYFAIAWNWMFQRSMRLMTAPALFYQLPFDEALPQMLGMFVTELLWICGPFLALVIVFGIAVNYLQIGPLFVFEPLKPELKKINPLDKAKQMFSMKNLIEFIKSVIKVVFLGVLIYLLLRDALPSLMLVPHSGLEGAIQMLGELMFLLALFTVFAYVVIAGADFGFQKWQHTKQLKMSKDEVKREYKEMEGDPTIKGKRKQLHQEMAMSESVERVKKSSVLITNPTHRAIAIYYKEGETKLPTILAKAEGAVAQRMIKMAKQEGIPIMRNIPLATDLFFNGDVEQYIPIELIEPVAEVLRWVRQLERDSNPSL
ncbi:MAG: type III secretion system export apparatus subunit SctU [Planctomycetota bacterium]